MDSLPFFLRARGMAIMLVGDGEAADAKRRLLERAGARIVGEDGAARIAIVALEDEAEAHATVARLRARGLLVNATDRPDLCDFTLPAIVDRDPVLIAIGTGGVSAGLAAALRQRLEALLPARLGDLARALGAARGALKARMPDAGERRRAIGALIAPGGALDPMIDQPDPAARILLSEPAAGRIERVTVASADPDELTVRAARLLAQADRLYHAPACPAAILDRARADAVRIIGAAPALPLPGLSVELIDAA